MIALFDIDGTLSKVHEDRLKMITQEPKDWEKFYKTIGMDYLNIPIADIARAMANNDDIIWYCTGRRESTRMDTMKWLLKQGLPVQRDRNILFMRPDGDYRKDTIVKPEIMSGILSQVNIIFEDRQCMVDKWRELGKVCVQVTKGDY